MEQLKQAISQLGFDLIFNNNSQFVDVTVKANDLHAFMLALKQTDNLLFDYLVNLSGIDWETNLSVAYHLNSTTKGHFMVVKAFTESRDNAVLDTVSDIWPAAEFFEREAFDLLGIRFNNHPDLRRLFLDDGWVGYPLRKDYTDDINLIERT